MNLRDVWNSGEKLAEEYLIEKGYQFVERNYFCRHGEIDLIMKKWDVYFFTEVKMRRSKMYGHPESSIRKAKLKAWTRSADYYLQQKHLDVDIALLVVTIEASDTQEYDIQSFELVGLY